MAENQIKTALVVSAHSGDFVWRAGGAIALYASRGLEGKNRLPLFRRAGRVGQALERRRHDPGAGKGTAPRGGACKPQQCWAAR